MASEDIRVLPIQAEDVPHVAQFLNTHLNSRPGITAWTRLMEPPWSSNAPNSGFRLVNGSTGIVGAYVGVYSERVIDGATHRFCNLGAFCVLPEFRAHSFRLLRSMLAQRGFEFTDLSPSGNVIALNERLGFSRLEGTTTLVPNLPRLTRRTIQISEDLGVIRKTLRGEDLTIFHDHRLAPAARHILAYSKDSYAYLVYRRDRRKRLPIFASPLYIGGDHDLLRRSWGQLTSRLLRHGLLATLAESRLLGYTPKGVWTLQNPRPKMVRSKLVAGADIDYLYSELTLLEW